MKDRKDKIKNITIVFLAVMLILTFFSNTIMNYSLVEVSTQMVTSGSITSKVRGSGTIEAGETYTVTLSESRKIATVAVKTGSVVESGDLLLTLEDTESAELSEAKKALEETQTAYETAILTAGLTTQERASIEAGQDLSLSQKQNAITNAKAAVANSEIAVKNYQALVDDITSRETALESSTVDTAQESAALVSAQKAQTSAQAEVSNSQLTLDNAQSVYDEAKSVLDAATAAGTATPDQQAAVDSAKSTLDSAKSAYTAAQLKLNNCTANVSNAQIALDAKSSSSEIAAQVTELKTELAAATAGLENEKAILETANSNYEALSALMIAKVSLASQYQSMIEQQQTVAELESKTTGTEITAPIAGTVTEIAYTAGQTITPEEAIMLIQPENKAFTLSFTVTATQAKKIKVGDTAEAVNNWWGTNLSAKVISVRRDTNDRQSSIVTCEVTGDVAVGDTYTLSIGEASANYDLIVPTSSIREDANGKFILIIESKSTPLGNRYYATRVDVDVITSDDTQTAISGALEGSEYVITTTTKVVEPGQQVRLAE